MAYLLSSLLRGLDAILCASSSLLDTTVLLEPKQCTDDVEHCLLTLEWSKQPGDEYMRHSYGCWPWQELKFKCPIVLGVCQLLHTSGDDLYKTCCCYGNMCNNQTLEYLPIPNGTADHMDDITSRMAKFGVRDANNRPLFPIPSHLLHQKNSSNLLPSTVVNILLPCLIGLIVVLTVLVIALRFSSSTQALRRKFSTVNTFQQRHSHSPARCTGKGYPCVCLHCCGVMRTNHLSSTAPVCAGDPNGQTGVQSGSGADSMKSQPGASSPSAFLKFDSMEWSVMQLVSQSCRIERCLGRGRFAQVWLAHVPAEVLLDPSGVLRRKSESVSNVRLIDLPRPLAHEEHQSDCSSKADGPVIGHWCKKLLPQTNNHTSAEIAVNTVDRNPQLVTIPELEGLLPSNVTSSLDDNLFGGFGVDSPSSPLAHSEACTDCESGDPNTEDTLKQVAVKVFLPHESRAWSNELTVFRALQQRSVHLESANSTVRSSGGKRYPDINPNVIRLFGAGIVSDAGFKSTVTTPMVREYRLVMEFASGGSLRNLLSSGEWIPMQQVVQLSRDITSGLTFLHRDATDTTLGLSLVAPKPPIAHRDLKPENILLRSNGSACLSDFGQAAILDFGPTAPFLTQSSDLVSGSDPGRTIGGIAPPNTLDAMPKAGTLRYMAPELLDGAINFTGVALLRTDVYSLGLVLWELLCAVLLSDLSPLRAPTIPKTEGNQPGVSRPHEIPTQPHVCHKRRHWLPYERELGENCNSPYALRQWVSAEKHRPMGDPAWYEYATLAHLYRTINECWDPEPEARLTADCVLERINLLQANLIKRCLQRTSEPTSFS